MSVVAHDCGYQKTALCIDLVVSYLRGLSWIHN